MAKIFTRERFGNPQLIALLLLVLLLGQCLWLAHLLISGTSAEDSLQRCRVEAGLRQWHGAGIAGAALSAATSADENCSWQLQQFVGKGGHDDQYHSPLYYLVASAPLLLWPAPLNHSAPLWRWLARLPCLLFGLLLGASLWYVARRLYGNAGGYIALLLYCFSPVVVVHSALYFSQPEMGAVWGTFGAVFTAIAVSHTLYAPREVVLWNWRRILLLGVSLALGIGSQFSLVWVLPLALAFMLYLAPERRAAAVVILVASCSIALFLLWAAYAFHVSAFWRGIRQAQFLGFSGQAFTMKVVYLAVISQLAGNGPVFLLMILIALVTYLAWPHARYFGNTAPLLVGLLFLALGIASPHYPGLGFQLVTLPFLFVFIAGIFSDLLQSRHRALALGATLGLLAAHVVLSLSALLHIRA